MTLDDLVIVTLS